MLHFAIYAMVYMGSLLMVYNVLAFIRFARYAQSIANWESDKRVLYVPIVLLTFFLLGYLGVGVFGEPDLLVGGIFFGGSIFVFIMHWLLNRVARRIVESEQLESELKAAEQSNATKTRILATMSHEMRTPMNVILGTSNVALRDPNLPADQRERFSKIAFSAQHMLSLINNILDMNALQNDEFVVKDEEFSLQGALNQVSTLIQAMAEDKGLAYATHTQGAMADTYHGDQLLIKQALLCILDNAVKYTNAPGSVSMEVQITPMGDDVHTLRCAIADTGIGMDAEFIPKLFSSFAQEDASTTNRFGGTGLSLAITKRTVEQMGGTIEVTSRKGEGSTFVVTLPLAVSSTQAEPVPQPLEHDEVATDAQATPHSTNQEEAQASTSPSEQEDEPAAEGVLAGKRVLIVEDIDENAEIVADLLELEEVESERAENGKVAVDMFAASPLHHFDAVLMDLRMPVMDGHEATRQIRKLDREDATTVPIIALTANAFESDIQASYEAGMNAHLAKPTDVDQLYDTLKQLV